MTGAVAIFVKTPDYSPLKTRLAAVTGAAFANAWYRVAAQAVQEVVLQTAARQSLHSYWAVAEAEAIQTKVWPDMDMLWQGEGGLGARMAHVYSQLVERHGFGILVGADAPQLSAEDIDIAIQWLDSPHARQVIGPACDGGFWLFGANRVIPESTWESVIYSRDDTAFSFMQAMENNGEWLNLRSLTDVDHVNDLPACISALQRLANPTPAQQRVLELSKTV